MSFWDSQSAWFLLLLLVLPGLGVSDSVAASQRGVANEARAKTNYMLNCQGCHGPDAAGNDAADVPRMKDFVGNFFRVEGGREFLVQVPGSSSASVDDAQLAELLNWMIPHFSENQLPENYVPYTESEVTRLRYTPEDDVVGKRRKLVDAIKALDLPVSSDYDQSE